ncbi:hypothetical protein G5714_024723 [Onychostoma macrolepis]|uniref:Uncharacterized protein n=1 Tax=Onychostoma macrolepis TaxID=369639 RepID=A0A7J6BIS0_9TELE|nr:hypothetical protein G5714_024723 [Onychostoma macrolepis]
MPPKPMKTAQKQVKSTVPGEVEADAKSNEASGEEGASGVGQESAILEAIHSLKSDFAVRFDGLLQAINGVQCDLKALTTRKDLRDLNIPELRYGILHPATLCVTYKGKRHLFDNPPDAQRFLQDLKDINA